MAGVTAGTSGCGENATLSGRILRQPFEAFATGREHGGSGALPVMAITIFTKSQRFTERPGALLRPIARRQTHSRCASRREWRPGPVRLPPGFWPGRTHMGESAQV